MKETAYKFRKIFPTYFLLLILVPAIYSLIIYLLFIELRIFRISQKMQDLWIPLILFYIPIYIFLTPKLRILTANNENAVFIIELIAFLQIFLLNMFVLSHIRNIGDKHISVQNANQISYLKGQKFRLDNYEIIRDYAGNYTDLRRKTDKHGNGDIEITQYTVMPFETKDPKNHFQLLARIYDGNNHAP